jgi:hypothetical protein
MNPLIQLLSPVGRMLRNKRPDVQYSVRHNKTLAAPGTIPDEHCSADMGPNRSPALSWTGVPPGTQQLLFILEDIDVPQSRPGLHTVALIDSSITAVGEGELKPGHPGARFIPTVMGRKSYYGPRPLPGHGVHHYGFHLYALDQAIPADRTLAGLGDILAMVDGHVLADGFLEGVKEA